MSKEKQIEERKKIISDICPFYKEYGTCEQCNKDLDIDDEPCYFECMANAIIKNDYRKQSEGEWQVCSDEYEICADEFVCSVCKESFVSSELTDEEFLEMMKFCPNCGAKMKRTTSDKVCTDCTHFVGCECFSGMTCDEYEEKKK